ncbi:terminase small subunit [Litorisediminicola beolgyonensis]|uniref:Terminase small subunit n=1 Tax=Litorisediminicola beolgyonensis TaxID=1173614 RepID=A0ABW3ZLL3_9RHOB
MISSGQPRLWFSTQAVCCAARMAVSSNACLASTKWDRFVLEPRALAVGTTLVNAKPKSKRSEPTSSRFQKAFLARVALGMRFGQDLSKRNQTRGGMLTEPKREAFCVAYALHGNATRAAVDAGYSQRSAYSQGSRLLKNDEVQNRIRQIRTERSERLEISHDLLFNLPVARATSNIAKFVDFNEDGSLDLTDKRASIYDLAVVKKLDVQTITRGTGDKQRTSRRIRIETHDPLPAIIRLLDEFFDQEPNAKLRLDLDQCRSWRD